MNDYERRQEEKRARLRKAAENRAAESDRKWESMAQVAAIIPLGQPILVGHHSEKRHRRDLKKIDNAMRASVELRNESRELARRADAIGTGGISQDDPDAVVKLRGELARMEVNQDYMQRVNKAWRKVGKPRPDNIPMWIRMANLLGCTVDDLHKERSEFARHEVMQRQPCPGWRLSNNSANIRRVKKRIEQLTKAAESLKHSPDAGAPATMAQGDGWKFVDDPVENRIIFTSPGKPSEAIRKALKSNGFRWSPNRGGWVAYRTAHWKVERLAEMCRLEQWHTVRSDRAIASAAALDARLEGVEPEGLRPAWAGNDISNIFGGNSE